MKIKAQLSEESAKKLGVTVSSVECEVNIPATLDDKVKLFGADVVNSAADDSMVIAAQAIMRRKLTPKKDKDGKITSPAETPEAIAKFMSTWRPDVKTVVRQSASEKAFALVGSLSDEDKKALLAKLTGGAASPKPATSTK